MIEFKGECGHTIRARDEDAGKIVRCSYCGKEALVTQEARDELDALFDEVEKTGVFDPQATKVGHRTHRTRQRAKARPSSRPAGANGFDPFAVALKMTYVAVIIIAVAVAVKYGRGLYHRWVSASDRQTQTAANTPPPRESGPRAGDRANGSKLGLLAGRLPRGQYGVYVSSVPAGGSVFVLPQVGEDVIDTILQNQSADKNMRTNAAVRIPTPGPQTIAVALQIANQYLMEMPGYVDLRRRFASREYVDNDEAAAYFVPDASVDTRLETIRGRRYLVRYYEVVTEKNHWTAVTAMFLPRDSGLDELLEYIPQRQAYGFNEEYVRRELDFHDIPAAQQRYIVDFLRRVGRACYRDAGGNYHSFQIEVEDGYLGWEVIERQQ